MWDQDDSDSVASTGGHKALLVADGDAASRRTIRSILEPLGYAVTVAEDGLEALALLETATNAVLSDVELPALSGFELARHIRQTSDTSTLPVILVGYRGSEHIRRRAREAGADAYLQRPFTRDQVLKALAEAENLRTEPRTPAREPAPS